MKFVIVLENTHKKNIKTAIETLLVGVGGTNLAKLLRRHRVPGSGHSHHGGGVHESVAERVAHCSKNGKQTDVERRWSTALNSVKRQENRLKKKRWL